MILPTMLTRQNHTIIIIVIVFELRNTSKYHPLLYRNLGPPSSTGRGRSPRCNDSAMVASRAAKEHKAARSSLEAWPPWRGIQPKNEECNNKNWDIAVMTG